MQKSALFLYRYNPVVVQNLQKDSHQSYCESDVEILTRKYEYSSREPSFKFTPNQPMATPHDVPRLHVLFHVADWAENLAIAP